MALMPVARRLFRKYGIFGLLLVFIWVLALLLRSSTPTWVHIPRIAYASPRKFNNSGSAMDHGPPLVLYRPSTVNKMFANPTTADDIRKVTTTRYFTAKGFSYCDILDGAVFDSLVYIKPLKGSIATKNPDISVFLNIIDRKAFEINKALVKRVKVTNLKETKRVACYLAAEGNTSPARLTTKRLLVRINPINYLKPVIPNIVPQPSVLPGARRKFKMAYLLMIHELNGFAHASRLLTLLDDGDAIILVHVDARKSSTELYKRVVEWVSERTATLGRESNIFLAQYRFRNIWGHISLVLTQLSGFWELLDMADWSYLINLSNYDYPIKSNAAMYEILSRPKNHDKLWIQHWPDTCIFL